MEYNELEESLREYAVICIGERYGKTGEAVWLTWRDYAFCSVMLVAISTYSHMELLSKYNHYSQYNILSNHSMVCFGYVKYRFGISIDVLQEDIRKAYRGYL